MSWAGYDRALPPEMLPNKLFDRLFGARDAGWVQRKQSILDAVQEDAARSQGAGTRGSACGSMNTQLGSRPGACDREPAAGVPPCGSAGDGWRYEGWPQIAKLQTDLLVHALASRQTRVASYMLTKCQGLSRFPGSAIRRLGTTITRTRTARRRARRARRPAGHAGHLPLARGGVRVPARQAEVHPGGRRQRARSHDARVRARARRSERSQEQRPVDDRGRRRRRSARPVCTHARRARSGICTLRSANKAVGAELKTFPDRVTTSQRAVWLNAVASGSGLGLCSSTIQCTPNRSATIPKAGEKKVFCIGIWTCPPSATASNSSRLPPRRDR